MTGISNSVLFLIFFLGFAIPLASQASLVLFDLIAAWICLSKAKVLIRNKQVRIFLWLFILFQGSMLFTTVVHGLPLWNFLRRSYGVTLLLFESMALFFVFSKADNKQALITFLGVMLGISMHYFYPADARVTDLPIKFLLGIPLGVALASLLSLNTWRSTRDLVVLSGLLLAYSGFCMSVGSRANGGVFFISAILVWARFNFVFSSSYNKIFPCYLIASFFLVYALSELYTYLALVGVFGETAQGIADFQHSFYGNILLGGRPEVIVNLVAFSDKPLIGHGPLVNDMKYLDFLSMLNVYSDEVIYQNEATLYHSMLFSAAHEAGVFATIFWIFIFYKIVLALPIIISMRKRLAAGAAALLISALWHVLFSPLIYTSRWNVALALGLAFFACELRVLSLRQGAS